MASQRFRFEQYLDVFEEHNIAFSIASFWSEKAFENLYSSGNFLLKLLGFIYGFISRAFLLLSLRSYQLVFIHREALPLGPPIWEWLAINVFRKRVIYDFDDAIWLQNTSAENSFVSGLKWHSKVNWIIKNAILVFAGNDWLADHARRSNDNVEVIPTTIDQQLHEPSPNQQSELTIGWTGTHSTLKYLDPILDCISRIQEDHEIEFLIISDKDPEFSSVKYSFKKFSLQTEIQDLDQIDIGLMPMPETEWAKGKCGFKLLQYMAMGKASVGSPVGVNKIILGQNERGLVAKTEQEWEQMIRKLIQDQELRQELGKKGLEFVGHKYSKASLKPKWEKLILQSLTP